MPKFKENLVMQSEETLTNFQFKGHCHFFEGRSTENFDDRSPTNIIQTDQPWCVLYHFEAKGLLNHLMCGKWRLELLLEKMGGQEFDLPESLRIHELDFASQPDDYVYVQEIPPKCVPAGVYRAVATVTFRGPKNVPGPIAAFADIGLVQFYEEGPKPPEKPSP